MRTVSGTGSGLYAGDRSERKHPGSPAVIQRVLGSPGPAGLVLVIGVSAVLGVVASRSAAMATVHLWGTVALLGAVALRATSPAPILAVTAYTGLCDVFWRMTSAQGPYEAAKYALIIGFGSVLVRFVRRPRRAGLPLILIMLLIPGALLGVWELGPIAAREYLIANLSGVVALALGVLVCWNIRATTRSIRYLYLAALAPCISVAMVATIAISTADNVQFDDASNFTAAGGFGPNQVSSLLSFGALLCVLLLLQRGVMLRMRLLLLTIVVWLAGQAVLTFSRGGLFGLVLALCCVGLATLTLRGQRMRMVVISGVVIVAGLQIMSWAGAFTGGASDERYSSTATTNRGEIALADLQVFYEQPITGVGVGLLATERDFSVESAPHTEYTRLLAEHGLAGIAALVVLAALSIRVIRSTDGWYRMASVGLIVMSLVQMSHSATRIGAIAFGFSVAALRGPQTTKANDASPKRT